MTTEQVKFLLNWNRFTDHLSSCMNKLLTDSSYSDIIIATADKQMIYSHRFVLASSSKYFQRVLRRINPNRGTQLVVALPEIKYDIFKILMNYMYKGVTQVPQELLPSVIKAGQFLEINGLMNLSESESGNSISKISNLSKLISGEPTQQKCATVHPSTRKTPAPKENNKLFGPIPQNLLNKINGKENNSVGSKTPNQIEANKTKKPNDIVDNHSGEMIKVENGKENKNNLAKPAVIKTNNDEKEDVIHLPLKRKTYSKDPVKKVPPLIISKSPTSTASSASASSFMVVESPLPKKRREIIVDSEDSYEEVVITTEKKKSDNKSAEKENQKVRGRSEIHEVQKIQEIYPKKQETHEPEKPQEAQKSQDPPGPVTKTVNIYSELKCEFCHNGFTRPNDWVSHMASKHADKGFKFFRDMKKIAENGPITCIMCSYAFVSREEYVKHINKKPCRQLGENKKCEEKVIKKAGVNEKK